MRVKAGRIAKVREAPENSFFIIVPYLKYCIAFWIYSRFTNKLVFEDIKYYIPLQVVMINRLNFTSFFVDFIITNHT